MPLPTFVIVGAQKSGTTTLHDWLGQVSGIWVSDPKEIHYFDRYQRRGPQWYSAQFEPATDDRAWGESTPMYLYRDRARADMAEALPTAQFIAILREPVSRAYSQYWFARSKGVETAQTFAEAIDMEPDRLGRHRDGQPAVGSYLDRGRYHRQLVALADRVGRDRILVHLLEDLQGDPREAVRKTCEFIGVHHPSLDHLDLQRRNTFGARTLNTARARERSDLSALDQPVGESYPQIDQHLNQELRSRFAPDNERLAAWLGRDLSDWA